jgi:dienelactone hydrolase
VTSVDHFPVEPRINLPGAAPDQLQSLIGARANPCGTAQGDIGWPTHRMTQRRTSLTDGPATLSEFTANEVSVDGVNKTVYRAGAGPAVILMPEMPGISPDVLRLAAWVRDAGFTVYLPSLFGTDGAYPTTALGEAVLRRACVSAEFRVFAGGGTSPIVHWLRGLARAAHRECGGRGVGAIGLCFTGNFALSMTLESAVIAPVLNHPSLPLDDPAGLELSDDDATAIRERFGTDKLTALAYRFDNDRWCTGQRFAAYRALLGDRFDGRVLPGELANPDPPPFFRDIVGCPHSVVTAHLIDRAGHPTLQARDEILKYLTHHLAATL